MTGGKDRPRFFCRDDFPLVFDFEDHIAEIQSELEYVMNNVKTPQFDEVVPGQVRNKHVKNGSE